MLKTLFHKVRGLVLATVALALTLGGATAVFAQGGAPATAAEARPRWGGGEVTALDVDNFTVHGPQGRERVVYFDANTVFLTEAGQPAAFSDLTLGARVTGSAERRADGQAYALLVIVFGPQTQYEGVGVVTGLEADAFHFVSRRGRVWEFYVDNATQFTNRLGEPLSFADLAVETRVFVQAELRDDGEWWALEVKIGR